MLTVILLLQLLWSGASLILRSDPKSTAPAAGSLQVDEIHQGAPLGEDLSQSLVERPVFWQGRKKFVPEKLSAEASEPERAPRNSNIDNVSLQGTYSAGDKTGVIVSYKDERRRLQRDEEIAGWTFTLLSEEGATFESGEATKVLELEHAKSVPSRKRAKKQEPPAGDAASQQEPKKPSKTGE